MQICSRVKIAPSTGIRAHLSTNYSRQACSATHGGKNSFCDVCGRAVVHVYIALLNSLMFLWLNTVKYDELLMLTLTLAIII